MLKETRLFKLIETLNKEDVDYAIAGGVAVALHGYLRATKDIDIIISFDKKNIERLIKAMDSLELKPYLPINPLELADKEKRKLWMEEKNMQVFSFVHPKDIFFRVDILLKLSTKDIKVENIKEKEICIPLISLKDLVLTKLASARFQDLEDIRQLAIIHPHILQLLEKNEDSS